MRCPFGQPMVEVFSVIFVGGGEPKGTISVYDGKGGQIIYRSERDEPVSQNGKNAVQLLLTGPYRAISADGCVAIQLDLPDRCKDQIILDIYSTSTKYDKATKVVKTCRDDAHAEVIYALLSNAVEAIVEVKLFGWERDDPVYGKITAHSDLGNVVLFESNDEDTCIRLSKGQTIIPLTRSVLAVTSTSSLRIEVDLRDHHNVEIVKGSAGECKPDLDLEHNLHLSGKNGQVDVKITWLD